MALRLAQNPLLLSTRAACQGVFGAPWQAARVHVGRVASFRAAQKVQVRNGDTFIKGDVNEATTFPPPSKTHGSYHWDFERIVSIGLVPLFAASAVQGAHPITDGLLSATLIVHSQLGFDQVLTDYVHQRKFPLLGPIAKWGVRGTTLLALYGLYEFNTNDIGITEFIIRIWHS